MKLKYFYLALVCCFCTNFAKADERLINREAAKVITRFISSVGTFNQFLDLIEKTLPKSESVSIRQQFIALGIDLDQKIPQAKYESNVIQFTGTNAKFEILNDQSLKVKFKTYRAFKKDKISMQLKEFINDLAEKKYSRFSFLVNEAIAADSIAKNKPLAIGSMAVAYVATISALNWAGATFSLGTGFAMVGMPVVVLGGMVWLGVEVYQTIRNGEVSCSGKYFVLRKKSRTLGLVPSADHDVIDSDAVKALLQKPDLQNCTEETAKAFQEAVKRSAKTYSELKAEQSLPANSSSVKDSPPRRSVNQAR